MEASGVEDPRVTEIEGMFYMTYTAYGLSQAKGFEITPMIARSQNLIDWEPDRSACCGARTTRPPALSRANSTAAMLALHRRPPQVWLAESDDLLTWPEARMRPVFGPRPEANWDIQARRRQRRPHRDSTPAG
jgi:predicted GH43/DUF377 family glycosyl hydrolase